MGTRFADRWGVSVQAGQHDLARALVAERAARKPTAEGAARQLVAANQDAPGE
jgi:hypothetical protein